MSGDSDNMASGREIFRDELHTAGGDYALEMFMGVCMTVNDNIFLIPCSIEQ